jgi:hypothetical protein
MDIKINNLWVNDEEENIIEEEEEIIGETIIDALGHPEGNKNIIENKEFNNLMNVPNNPIDDFNLDNFMKNLDEPVKEDIIEKKPKPKRKKLFEFGGKKINYNYVLPIIGIASIYFLMK